MTMTLGVIGDPSVVDRTLISALRYPNVAAIACGAWTVGRILYTFGYTSEAPEKVSERHAVCVLCLLNRGMLANRETRTVGL